VDILLRGGFGRVDHSGAPLWVPPLVILLIIVFRKSLLHFYAIRVAIVLLSLAGFMGACFGVTDAPHLALALIHVSTIGIIPRIHNIFLCSGLEWPQTLCSGDGL